MYTATQNKSLMQMTAADLMTSPVTTIPQNLTLREAATLLHRANISGAPVVDEFGKCLGILSSNDFISRVEHGDDREESITFIGPNGEWISIDENADSEVCHYMTSDTVMVPPTTPVAELAKMMVDAHIHRILVMDAGEVCGIVTSTDILAAVVREAMHE